MYIYIYIFIYSYVYPFIYIFIYPHFLPREGAGSECGPSPIVHRCCEAALLGFAAGQPSGAGSASCAIGWAGSASSQPRPLAFA